MWTRTLQVKPHLQHTIAKQIRDLRLNAHKGTTQVQNFQIGGLFTKLIHSI